MATNYIQTGNVLEHEAAADIESGSVVVFGEFAGVALGNIAEGEVGAVQVSGVFELSKSGDAFAQGAKAYYKEADKQVVSAASGNKLIGLVTLAAASGDETVQVKLS